MNRQVVQAQYQVYSTFVVPEGIDLENTEQVEDWWIKWDVLHIELSDGRKLKVEPYYSASECDYKRPDEENVEDDFIESDYKEEEHVEEDDD